MVSISVRVPEPTRDRATEIAAAQGMTRSAWLARVIARAVEAYPLEDVD